MNQDTSQNAVALQSWIDGTGTKKQITRTIYDEVYTPISSSVNGVSGLYQKNLRNRVSYTYVKELDSQAASWDAASFYTYDIHGNVDTLVQDYQTGMGAIACSTDPTVKGNRFKKIVYSYDLISGKVNDVAYQPNQPDQFYHRYNYDAENRLTEVQTSKDKIYWEHDAEYDYYRHGPLARTELGQNKVQGLDYAYTIQGWLKGVNATAVLTTATGTSYDMGRDGVDSSLVARDAYGFSLNYFTGDYKTINTSVRPFARIPMTLPADGGGITTGAQLFNGNIAAMAVNMPKLGTPNVYGYRYDQLNRIVRMDAFTGLSNSTDSFTTTPVRVNDYHEAVSYDPNGNIKKYQRNGDSRSNNMDSLGYIYIANTNQLNHVTDAVTAATPSDYTDIKTQPVNNYRYDKIGNLISDSTEGISNIEWTVYGKIKTISKTNDTTIRYTYDASGNRISKIVTTATTGDSTYYVRDAGGNLMSVYNKKGAVNLAQTELHLYGSSRLGVYNVNVEVQNCSNTSNPITIFTRGNKFFELSNHLGNVLVTVSDKKLQHSTNGTTVDYYNADVVTANDYYPFGSQMPGRKYSRTNSAYRYGFNGQEKSDEIKGDGNSYTAEFWEYDPRVGRRWNLDPNPTIGVSDYVTFLNNPISFTDALGDTARPYGNAEVTNTTLADKGGTVDLVRKRISGKEVNLVPAATPAGKIIGYNIWDNESKLNHPIGQIDAGDLNEFQKNQSSYVDNMRTYYMFGEPSLGQKLYAASVEKAANGDYSGAFKLAGKSVIEQHKEAYTNPIFVVGLLSGYAATFKPNNLVNIRSTSYVPIKAIEVEVKNAGTLKFLQNQQSGTWIKVYEAAYINKAKVEVHYFLHKQTGAFFDSKIKQVGWSSQFLKGKNKIIGH